MSSGSFNSSSEHGGVIPNSVCASCRDPKGRWAGRQRVFQKPTPRLNVGTLRETCGFFGPPKWMASTKYVPSIQTMESMRGAVPRFFPMIARNADRHCFKAMGPILRQVRACLLQAAPADPLGQ